MSTDENRAPTVCGHVVQRLVLSFLLVHPHQEERQQGEQENGHGHSNVKRQVRLRVSYVRCKQNKKN